MDGSDSFDRHIELNNLIFLLSQILIETSACWARVWKKKFHQKILTCGVDMFLSIPIDYKKKNLMEECAIKSNKFRKKKTFLISENIAG